MSNVNETQIVNPQITDLVRTIGQVTFKGLLPGETEEQALAYIKSLEEKTDGNG